MCEIWTWASFERGRVLSVGEFWALASFGRWRVWKLGEFWT